MCTSHSTCSAPDAQSTPVTAPDFKEKPHDVEVSEFEDVTLKATVAGTINQTTVTIQRVHVEFFQCIFSGFNINIYKHC